MARSYQISREEPIVYKHPKMLNSEETLYFFTLLIGPLGYMIKIIISHDLSVGGVGMIYGVISFVSLL
jgi:hypothetical protein